MAELYVNVNGTWKQATNYYVNVNGTWKEGSELHAKVSSAWKESGGVYSGTSGIVTTDIVLDLNTTISNSYGGSSTTWTDLSGNSNNATLVNGVAYSGLNGGYLIFDGSNDHATLPEIDISGNEITFTVWNYGTSNQYSFLLYLAGDSSNNRVLSISLPYPYPTNTNQIYFDKGTASGYDRINFGATNSEYQGWHHWAFTANASTGSMKIYLDGVLRHSGTGKNTSIGTPADGIQNIGSKDGNSYHIGYISQILLYKKELSASEVLQNYLATGTTYFGDIVTDNLVLNLDASNSMSYSGSGTTWDDISGQGNNATLVNGPVFNSAEGGYFVFDGTNDSVTISGMSSFAPSAITFEVWFYNTPASGYKGLVDKGRDNYQGYSLSASSSKVQWKARVGSSNEVALDTEEYQDSVWTHAVGTYDGTDLKLYVNGVLKTTINSSGTLGSNSHGITIGSTNDNLYFDGRISQVRIYSSALTASQVLQNYNATKSNYIGIITRNIVLHLNATNSNSYSGSGTTWSNLVNTSYNATLVNGVAFNSNHGGTLFFDGTNDYAEITSASGLGNFSGDFTIEFWWKGPSQGSYRTILDHYQGTSTSTALRWAVQTAGGNMFLRVDGAFTITTSGGTPNDDKWHHHVVSRVGSTITYYIDTVSRGTATNSSNIGSSGNGLKIGAYLGGYQAEGSMSQLRIYDGTGLTASEVLQNYNATKSNYTDFITTDLVLYLDASNASSYGGAGTTWSDISGGGNNYTLTNGPTFNLQDGGVIVFDGINDFAVSALNQAFFQFGTGDYSYGLWVKLNSQPSSSYAAVLSSGWGSASGSWQIDLYYTSKFRHRLKNSGGGTDELATTTISNFTNNWIYLFVVNDRSEDELKIYVNGTLNATGSSTNYGSTNVGNFGDATDVKNVLSVAQNRNQDSVIDGSVGQVHVYKGKALTASEVLQNYNDTKGNFLGAISTTNLVFYLDAGKSMSYSGSGTTWTDLSSSSKDGTLTNGPTFDSDFGGSIVFDGSNDRIETGSNIFNPNSDFTFTAWINLDATSGNYTIVSDYTNVGKLQLRYKNGYGLQIIDSTVTLVDTFSSSETLAAGTWYNITVTRSSNTYTYYLNGSQVSSFTSSNTYNGGPQTLGANHFGTSEYFDGKIAQAFAYSSALSASDVLSNYNATKDTYGYATVSDPSGIIPTGLDILLDAGNPNSYYGSGTTWTNLAPSSSPFSNATLSSATGTNTYSSSNSGYFDECRAFVPVTGSTYGAGGTTITYPTMTYSVWCYPDNLGGYQTLVDQGNDNWFFGFQTTTLITYDPNTSTGSGVVANNNWYNLTMTHTQNDVVKFYINGIKHSQTEGTYNTVRSFSNWSFGGGSVTTSGANEGFKGYIAAIAVYNRALSAREVLQNHNALKSRFGL